MSNREAWRRLKEGQDKELKGLFLITLPIGLVFQFLPFLSLVQFSPLFFGGAWMLIHQQIRWRRFHKEIKQ